MTKKILSGLTQHQPDPAVAALPPARGCGQKTRPAELRVRVAGQVMQTVGPWRRQSESLDSDPSSQSQLNRPLVLSFVSSLISQRTHAESDPASDELPDESPVQ